MNKLQKELLIEALNYIDMNPQYTKELLNEVTAMDIENVENIIKEEMSKLSTVSVIKDLKILEKIIIKEAKSYLDIVIEPQIKQLRNLHNDKRFFNIPLFTVSSYKDQREKNNPVRIIEKMFSTTLGKKFTHPEEHLDTTNTTRVTTYNYRYPEGSVVSVTFKYLIKECFIVGYFRLKLPLDFRKKFTVMLNKALDSSSPELQDLIYESLNLYKY